MANTMIVPTKFLTSLDSYITRLVELSQEFICDVEGLYNETPIYIKHGQKDVKALVRKWWDDREAQYGK